MSIKIFSLLLLSALLSSCFSNIKYYTPVKSNEKFTIKNTKGQKLFDITTPNGKWDVRILNEIKREGLNGDLKFMYKGKYQGMIDVDVRISFKGPCFNCLAFKEFKDLASVEGLKKDLDKELHETINGQNFITYYKPKNLESGIKRLAGLNCSWWQVLNHSGPKLDSVVQEFRGLGSARKEEKYYCPVMRDDGPWWLYLNIVYYYSDLIQKHPNDNFGDGLNKNIPPFPVVFKRFDEMIKPTLDNLKLYGNLKQY